MKEAVGSVVQRLRNVFAIRESTEQSDAELIQRFVAKADALAFEAIVRRHGPMILGVCRRLLHDSADADDAFQATFAILVRKAASLSRPAQLAGWLFQVAYRTARRARANRMKKAFRQVPLPELAVESPIAEIVWREIQPIFDEEVARLPDKLRIPIVLCFLEGRTKRAAAQSLGWAEGTFSCRLQRAREQLRTRLARRGVTLSAGAFCLALFQGSSQASVPAALLASTVHSAALIVAGTAVSGPVAVLSQGVIQSMFISKIKTLAAIVVTMSLLGGGAGWIVQSGAGSGDSAVAGQPGQTPAEKNTPTNKPNNQVNNGQLTPKAKADIVERPLKFVDAALAATMVKTVLEDAKQFRVTVDNQTNTIYLSGPPETIAKAKQCLDELDRAGNLSLKIHVTKPGTAEALAKNLSEVFKSRQNLRIWYLNPSQIMVLAAPIDQVTIASMLAQTAREAPIDVTVEEAEVKQRAADLELAQLKHKLKTADADRVKEARSTGIVSASDLDKAIGDVQLSAVEIKQAQAALERAQAVLERVRKSGKPTPGPMLRQPNAPAKEMSLQELEDRVQRLQLLRASGAVSDAELDHARITMAEARIIAELKIVVQLRQNEVNRAAQLRKANAITDEDHQKSVDALKAAERRLADWK